MLPLPRLPAQSIGDADAYPVEAGQRSAIHFTLAGIEHQSLQPEQSRFEPVTSGWKAAASQASNHYVLTQPIIHKQSLGAQLKIRELNLFFASPLSLAHRAPQPKCMLHLCTGQSCRQTAGRPDRHCWQHQAPTVRQIPSDSTHSAGQKLKRDTDLV